LTNKLCTLLLVSLLVLPIHAELLKWNWLQKPAARFSVKQDLFGSGSAAPRIVEPVPAAQAEALQNSIAEEIYQSISYEGFIVKNSKRSALLNVSGEFFVVSEQDMILDKIKILKINKDIVTIEYDSLPYDIRIKGEQNG